MINRYNMLRERSLIYAIEKQTDLSYEESERVYRIIFASISRAIARGYKVHIDGFGTFWAVYLSDHRTESLYPDGDGETEHISYAHMKVKFKAHKWLDDKVRALMPHPQRYKEKPKWPE